MGHRRELGRLFPDYVHGRNARLCSQGQIGGRLHNSFCLPASGLADYIGAARSQAQDRWIVRASMPCSFLELDHACAWYHLVRIAWALVLRPPWQNTNVGYELVLGTNARLCLRASKGYQRGGRVVYCSVVHTTFFDTACLMSP